jgi:hypothetical protein
MIHRVMGNTKILVQSVMAMQFSRCYRSAAIRILGLNLFLSLQQTISGLVVRVYGVYVVSQLEFLSFYPIARCQKIVDHLFWQPRRVFFDGLSPDVKALWSVKTSGSVY